MAVQIEARRTAAVEHMNQRCVADAVERAVKRDSVVDPERAHLLFGYRRVEVVVSHVSYQIFSSKTISNLIRRESGACTARRVALHVDRDRIHRDMRRRGFDVNRERSRVTAEPLRADAEL